MEPKTEHQCVAPGCSKLKKNRGSEQVPRWAELYCAMHEVRLRRTGKLEPYTQAATCVACDRPPAPRTSKTGSHPKYCDSRECELARGRAREAAWRRAHPEHQERASQALKQWRRANPQDWAALQRRHQLKLYGLTPESYEEMLRAQGRGCAICNRPTGDSRGNRLHVDHCHESQVVRGLLCKECNNGLGMFRDNPELLRRAAAYLEVPRQLKLAI